MGTDFQPTTTTPVLVFLSSKSLRYCTHTAWIREPENVSSLLYGIARKDEDQERRWRIIGVAGVSKRNRVDFQSIPVSPDQVFHRSKSFTVHTAWIVFELRVYRFPVHSGSEEGRERAG